MIPILTAIQATRMSAVLASSRRRLAECLLSIRNLLAHAVRNRPQRKLKLRETLPLGDRRFIALVQFEDQQFLLGGTPNSLVLLKSLHTATDMCTGCTQIKACDTRSQRFLQ